MKVVEAKELVLDLISRNMREQGLGLLLDARSPDPKDPGKFVFAGKTARAIHPYDGWFVPINRAASTEAMINRRSIGMRFTGTCLRFPDAQERRVIIT